MVKKIKVLVWSVSVAQYAANEKGMYLNTRTFNDSLAAYEIYKSACKWLMEFAKTPEKENGTFKGRIFNITTNTLSDSFIVHRCAKNPIEKFEGEVRIDCTEIEVEVPISLNIDEDGYIKVS